VTSAFLERMNTLLASGEVPGLFEGEEYASLLHQIREASTKAGEVIDSEAELFKWFSKKVRTNLHVVFTMYNLYSILLSFSYPLQEPCFSGFSQS